MSLLESQPGKKGIVERLVQRITSPERRRNPYIRTSPDGTRDIWIWRDSESQVDRVIMHAVSVTGGSRVCMRIMEICRSGGPEHARYSLMLEAVDADKSPYVTRFVNYNTQGYRYISGGSFIFSDSSVAKSRSEYLQRGYMSMKNVPHHIDFNQTVTQFLLNAMSPDPSFETPTLIPYADKAPLPSGGRMNLA